MYGGLGDDLFKVDSASDQVNENISSGTDTVWSSVTHTLGANLENLQLTGTLAINGTGNSASNQVLGNAAANTLSGGAGDDLLDGGLGLDVLSAGRAMTRSVLARPLAPSTRSTVSSPRTTP